MQLVLAEIPLTTFLSDFVVPYETDEVTRLIVYGHDKTALARVHHGEFGDWLLSDEADQAALSAPAPGVSKIMRLQDLVTVAAKILRSASSHV